MAEKRTESSKCYMQRYMVFLKSNVSRLVRGFPASDTGKNPLMPRTNNSCQVTSVLKNESVRFTASKGYVKMIFPLAPVLEGFSLALASKIVNTRLRSRY